MRHIDKSEVPIMHNYLIVEPLGQQHVEESLREADRARLVRLAETDREPHSVRKQTRGGMMPDAAGARQVPSL